MAAGNVDGLPAYSVVEGLLAGNVNILKLPAQDRGASPPPAPGVGEAGAKCSGTSSTSLTYPPQTFKSLERFAKIADAVVVWGGDEAVRAARTLAGPDTALICWGHKLSFAYAVPPVSDGDLEALADHICATGQLLCSSCQGIFLDSEDMREVEALGERFFAILQEENRRHPPADMGLRAKATLHLRTEELEAHESGRRILRGGGVSVTVAPDSKLELSWLGGNCWVKPLPRARILSALKGAEGVSPDRGAPLRPRGALRAVRPAGQGRAGADHRGRGDVPNPPR